MLEDNWQLVWNAQVSISTAVCVNFELRPGTGDIYICWFNFDALAQGNAYKPTEGTDKLSWTRRGSNSRLPDWGNTASFQFSSTAKKKTIPITYIFIYSYPMGWDQYSWCKQIVWENQDCGGMCRNKKPSSPQDCWGGQGVRCRGWGWGWGVVDGGVKWYIDEKWITWAQFEGVNIWILGRNIFGKKIIT